MTHSFPTRRSSELLCAEADVCARAKEQGPVVRHVAQEEVRITGHHLHMLGCNVVRDAHHLDGVVRHDNLSVALPCLSRVVGCRKTPEYPFDPGHRLASEFFRRTEENGRDVGAVTGLTEMRGWGRFDTDHGQAQCEQTSCQ